MCGISWTFRNKSCSGLPPDCVTGLRRGSGHIIQKRLLENKNPIAIVAKRMALTALSDLNIQKLLLGNVLKFETRKFSLK
jgi:hypothetical protein